MMVMTYLLYFGYMFLFCFAMFLVMGTVGALTSLWFIRKIFATIKVDKWSELSQKQTERILEKMSYLESRVTKGLANLTAGVEAKCPKIVYIVPLYEEGAPSQNIG